MEQVALGVSLVEVAVWLTAWIIGASFTLYSLMKRTLTELKTEIGELRNEVAGLGEDITNLRERTSSLVAKVGILVSLALPPEARRE